MLMRECDNRTGILRLDPQQTLKSQAHLLT
jgi:hypothetical protein